MSGRRAWMVALAVVGCEQPGDRAIQSETALPPIPRRPVAFFGTWQRVAPIGLRGGLVQFTAEARAAGAVPWPGRGMVPIDGWEVRFMSRDPVGSRQDWRSGYSDGGDASCLSGDSSCVSLPMLCVSARGEWLCEAFEVSADSLLTSSGLRYARVRETADSTNRRP